MRTERALPSILPLVIMAAIQGRARFASEEGGPNEDTALTMGGMLTPSEVQLHSS